MGLPADGDKDGTQQLRNVLVSLGQHQRRCLGQADASARYVINIKNNPMTTYRYRMHQEDLAKQFGRWYRIAHGDKKTVCLLGIRADESLQRYSGFLNRKYGYKETC